MDENVIPNEDFGESVGGNIPGCHWGPSIMTPVRSQFLSLSCVPHVVCDVITAKLAVSSKRFLEVMLARPNRSLPGSRPGSASFRGCSSEGSGSCSNVRVNASTRGQISRSGRGQTSGARCASESGSRVDVVPISVTPIPFSVQEVYDCADRDGLAMTLGVGFKYVIDNGIYTEKKYPFSYQNCREDCQCASKFGRKITVSGGWRRLREQEVLCFLKVHPLVATISYRIIRNYCLCPDVIVRFEDVQPASDPTVLSHAFLVIGFDYDGDGKLFYVIKNSWGRIWGCRGYLKFEATLLGRFYMPNNIIWRSPEDVHRGQEYNMLKSQAFQFMFVARKRIFLLVVLFSFLGELSILLFFKICWNGVFFIEPLCFLYFCNV